MAYTPQGSILPDCGSTLSTPFLFTGLFFLFEPLRALLLVGDVIQDVQVCFSSFLVPNP
jgi:hypothetical protein